MKSGPWNTREERRLIADWRAGVPLSITAAALDRKYKAVSQRRMLLHRQGKLPKQDWRISCPQVSYEPDLWARNAA